VPATDGVQIDKANALMLARYQGMVFRLLAGLPPSEHRAAVV
jgi:hypothetical protein